MKTSFTTSGIAPMQEKSGLGWASFQGQSFSAPILESPPSGSLKLNVDGSCLLESSSIGAGGVICDHTYNWIVGVYSFDGLGDSAKAEIMALRHGLILAWDKGFRNILCEMDNKNMVDIFNNNCCPDFHPHIAVVLIVLELIN
ncbi:hypothetical protein D0Y65_018654 [Glycine soja]|uniref:RNase H type-1 domain-containing protein n=1 Tax=Glycine soja TaxID=3848 RepID=A0A445K025_GLYSO|nr:hypothetical protein D0Y65_018654 [Glycine soja]